MFRTYCGYRYSRYYHFSLWKVYQTVKRRNMRSCNVLTAWDHWMVLTTIFAVFFLNEFLQMKKITVWKKMIAGRVQLVSGFSWRHWALYVALCVYPDVTVVRILFLMLQRGLIYASYWADFKKTKRPPNIDLAMRQDMITDFDDMKDLGWNMLNWKLLAYAYGASCADDQLK